MDENNPPWEGRGGPHPGGVHVSPSRVTPGQTLAEATQVASTVAGGNLNSRTFEEIIAEEEKNRNILEISLKRANQQEKVMNLTFDDLSIFIFDILKI